jgi:hypothetical protein
MVVHVGLLLTIQAALCIAGDLQLEPFLQKHGLARPSIEDRHVQDIAVSRTSEVTLGIWAMHIVCSLACIGCSMTWTTQ